MEKLRIMSSFIMRREKDKLLLINKNEEIFAGKENILKENPFAFNF